MFLSLQCAVYCSENFKIAPSYFTTDLKFALDASSGWSNDGFERPEMKMKKLRRSPAEGYDEFSIWSAVSQAPHSCTPIYSYLD